MPARYLLDTNTCSYIIKGNIPGVREHLRRVRVGEVAVSTVSEAELRFGVLRLAEAQKLALAVDAFLLRLEILAWDSGSARQYAQIRVALERVGQPMGNLDMMIAAQALAAGATLVSHDSVFQRVKGLKVVDWAT